MLASVRSLNNLPLDIEGPQAGSQDECEKGDEGWRSEAKSEASEGWASESESEVSEGWEREESEQEGG